MSTIALAAGAWVAGSITLTAAAARFFWWLEGVDSARDAFNFDAEEASTS